MTITYDKPINKLADERAQRFQEKRQRQVKIFKKRVESTKATHCGGYRERMRRARNMAKHGSPG